METEALAIHGAAAPRRVPAQRRTLLACAAAVAAGLFFVAAVSVYRDQVVPVRYFCQSCTSRWAVFGPEPCALSLF